MCLILLVLDAASVLITKSYCTGTFVLLTCPLGITTNFTVFVVEQIYGVKKVSSENKCQFRFKLKFELLLKL